VKRGLDILKELGAVEVVLSGGDPLLRDDIGEILEYASQFFITTVYDNGSMATKKIDALRLADFVAISIDSLDPKRNDYLRGVEGAWHNAMEAVEKLHEEGISVSVSPTISQFNLYEILDFTEHFLKKNIPIWYCMYSYDSSIDQDHLFRIGREEKELAIVDREAMASICAKLMEMKKKNSNILMTSKILKTVKNLYSTGQRAWKCKALQNFFIIDHLGRVAGCHLHNPAASIFDLPKAWNSPRFEALRKTYSKCTQCTYLCYIFYSLHGSVLGNFQIAEEQWRNARLLLKRNSRNILMTPSRVKPR